MARCYCGKVIRAKELRKWAISKGKKLSQIGNSGVYVVYQERNRDGQGHVYAVIDGKVFGNELADQWKSWDFQEFYKIK